MVEEFDIVVENEEPIDVTAEVENDFLKGDKGDPTATIEIGEVITGEAGTEAKIENLGTDVNLKLNITIPKGDKGDKGEQGGKGEDGYTPIKGTDYFTETEIQQIKQDILNDVSSFDSVIVEELPTENIQEKTMYLVLSNAEEEIKQYDAYIYKDNEWRQIGSVNLKTSAGDTLPVGTIVEYDGDTVPEGYEEVEDEGEVYSTEEQVVGKWIDGKILYKRTVKYTSGWSLGNSAKLPINFDVETICMAECGAFKRNGDLITLPYVCIGANGVDKTWSIILSELSINSKDVGIYVGESMTSLDSVVITFYYTKPDTN